MSLSSHARHVTRLTVFRRPALKGDSFGEVIRFEHRKLFVLLGLSILYRRNISFNLWETAMHAHIFET